jgi:hypothetical protein
MATHGHGDNALAPLDRLDRTVRDALAYFEGIGPATRGSAHIWGAWEVLSHFLFWHEATIEGMQSVARGGDAHRLKASADELNAEAVAKHQGASLPDLTARLGALHEELRRAVNSLPNLDIPVMMRVDGTLLTGRQRLEAIDRHWAQHMVELEAARQS